MDSIELPDISLIIVNLNGRELLPTCLDALTGQDFPPERVETIVVDNGSTDDSVSFVRERYPAVKVIEAGQNLGFAGGNNLGARVAGGKYLALLNNDACATPDWLSTLAGALEAHPDVGCVASKILAPDGKTIDFVGPVMNLYGRAFQVDEGVTERPGDYDEPRELLAPCGGAMMIRREVFWQAGGFDEDYVAYYEDIDLGWRLWLLGHRILFIPGAIVHHRPHQTGSRFAVEQRYALSEANALRTIIKNYSEENLWRVLPLSLLLGVRRSLDQARLDRGPYTFGQPAQGSPQAGSVETEQRMTRVATSFLVAIDQVAEEMPHLLAKRRKIQAERVRSDEEIFARFPMRPDNWLFPWREYHVLQDQLADSFSLPAQLKPKHGARLLIVTHETIGRKMAGPGIRAWELACALAERFDVTLAAPGQPDRQRAGLRVVGYQRDDPGHAGLRPYIASADVILAMGPLFIRIPQLWELNKPVIVDLYDPYEVEKLAQAGDMPAEQQMSLDVESVNHLRTQSTIGDFYICASERQRDFWMGVLLSAGRANAQMYAQDPTLRKLINVVPFGVPEAPPQRRKAVLKGVHPGIGPDDKVLLWNGGLWQWFDPLTLLEALAVVRRQRPEVRLFFAAGKHFDPGTVPEMPIYAQVVERGA